MSILWQRIRAVSECTATLAFVLGPLMQCVPAAQNFMPANFVKGNEVENVPHRFFVHRDSYDVLNIYAASRVFARDQAEAEVEPMTKKDPRQHVVM